MTVSPNIIKNSPVVCAAGTNYVIYVQVTKKVLMSITVGSKTYYNHVCGIKVSDTKLQRFTVPMTELDSYKAYTIVYEEIICRLPYTCTKKAMVSVSYKFKPVEVSDKVCIYHISDTHGQFLPAVRAAGYYDRVPDLLILNGDISSSSSTINELMLPFNIAAQITGGSVPCIITRGNHDLRGKLAEKLCDFLPNINGCFYYTVRLGDMWFMCLDCGEDKQDAHREYSGTVCFHEIREAENEFIDDIIKASQSEYNAPGVRYRFIISHIPFCNSDKGEFNIENKLYGEWCKKINEHISPDLLICGHTHTLEIYDRNSDFDDRKIGCPVLLGGKPKTADGRGYAGAALCVEPNLLSVSFTDSDKNVLSKKTIKS